MPPMVQKAILAILAISILGILGYVIFRGNSALPGAAPSAKGEAKAKLPTVSEASNEAAAEAPSSQPPEEPAGEMSIPSTDAGLDSYFARLAALAELPKGDASISGIVMDKQGKPLSGMSIISGDMFATQLPPTTTDTDGKFSASELVPGEYKLMAVPAVSGGIGIDSAHQTVTLNAGQSLSGIRLVYEGATHRTVSGIVTDAKGVPIAGARVDANDPMASVMFSSFTETGTDGRFVLEAREGKRFDMSVTHPSYTTFHSARLEAGTNDLAIILQGRGTIIGQVVDATTGKPVTQFEAGSGVRWHPKMLGVRSMASATFDDLEGRFTLPSVEVGEVNVYVRAQGYAPLRIQAPEIRSDEIRDLGVVRLAGGASLEGTVADMNGAPVSRALILLGGTRDTEMFPPYFSTSRFSGEQYHAMTDDEGRFVIDSLSPELTEIALQHADHPRTVNALALEMGKRTTVQLVMTGFATVEGTVYVNGEKAGPRNSVSVQHDSWTVSRSAETDENGFYRIEEVPGGTVTVQAGTSEGGAHRSVEAEAATELGHTTVVDLYVEFGTATITGNVLWEGEPVPNVLVSAAEVDGEDRASGMVSPDGAYQLSGLTGGEYRIYVADVMSGEPRILGTARGTVAAGETATVDIECKDQ